MESIEVPCDISFQLWYLDDGTFVGSCSAVADLLDLLATQGPSFGFTLNLKKCEVFWPSGDSSFPTFPQEVNCPLQILDGVELLGSLFSAVSSSLMILLIPFLTRFIVYKTYYLGWKILRWSFNFCISV